MAASRLQTALDDGALSLPPGRIAVLRPPAGYDLSPVPRGDAVIVQGFFPDAARWRAAGHEVLVAPAGLPPVVAALVVIPRSKALARALVAEAAGRARLVLVDGQRTDGIDSLWREMRGRIGDLPSVSRAHGRLFWFAVPDADPAAAGPLAANPFADWALPAPRPGPDGFLTLPGVFSEGGADAGSRLLAAALPATLPGRMADLGAGWGYLSRAVLAREGVKSLDLIEAEALALDCARLNVIDPRAAFHWADATTFRAERPYDGIVMNPPFHRGRDADPGLGRAFIAAAARLLGRDGALWMVANRHLPYEAALEAAFRNVAPLGGDGGFKILHASRPLR